MRSILWMVAGAIVAGPAVAQTQQWSTVSRTEVWSTAPTTSIWSEDPALSLEPQPDAPGQTQLWATTPTTQIRSEAEIQEQVNRIIENVERSTAGMGGGPASSSVPDDLWRAHTERLRADDQFMRDQEAYRDRQQYYRGN